MALRKIVTGGQTGVDRGALDAALELGFPCGGWCPSGRQAEDGIISERYPLAELPEGGYRERTLRNVLDSDGTAIIYFGRIEGGTAATLAFCIQYRKPYKLLDASLIDARHAANALAEWVKLKSIADLNIAGPRLSTAPRAEDYARRVIRTLLANRAG